MVVLGPLITLVTLVPPVFPVPFIFFGPPGAPYSPLRDISPQITASKQHLNANKTAFHSNRSSVARDPCRVAGRHAALFSSHLVSSFCCYNNQFFFFERSRPNSDSNSMLEREQDWSQGLTAMKEWSDVYTFR